MQDVIVSKRCNDCRDVLPMQAFRFDTKTMKYWHLCQHCERDSARERAAKYRDRKRAEQWPEAELAVIREHYPLGGSAACEPFLSGRNRNAIRAIAKRIGLTYEGPRLTGSPPKDEEAVPVPAHDYTPEDRAWMTTRLPVFGGGFGVARIAA